MTIRTYTLPSGRTWTFDDRGLPRRPGGKDMAMGLLGQAAGPIAGVGAYYAGKGLLDGASTSAGAALPGASLLMPSGETLSATTPIADYGEMIAAGGAPGTETLTGSVSSGMEGGASFAPGEAASAGWALPAASTLAGGYGLYDVASNQNRPRWMSALEGGAALPALGWGLGGLGAATGLLATNPVTLPVALGLGAAGLLGGGLLGGHKSTKEREKERWGDVGVDNPYEGGHDYFAGTGGEESRDESLLTADAIRNNPDNFTAAQDYAKWEKANQDKFLNALLEKRLVTEKKGGIYYDDDKAKVIADNVRQGRDPYFGLDEQSVS